MKKQKKIFNIVKMELRCENIIKNLIISISFFSLIFIIMARNLVNGAILYNFEINFWDIIFRVSTYPFFIVVIFVPIMLILTGTLHRKTNYMNHLYLRIDQKRNLVISNILSVFLINIIATTIIFLILLVIGLVYSKYDTNWSTGILNANSNLDIFTQLYPCGFIDEFTPLKAFAISYIEVFIGLNITICIRDLLCEYLTNLHIANILTSIYIAINYIFTLVPLLVKSLPQLEYISINNIMILWCHKFSNISSYGKITVMESMISSMLILLILISVRLIFARRLVINNDF